LFVPPDNGTTTFARMAVEDVVVRAKVSARAVIAGDVVSLGRLGVARVLWPAGGKAPMPTVILMMEYAGRRVLMMDPGNVAGLGLLSLSGADLRCDCVLLMGPDRGRGDEELRNLLVKAGAGAVVYSGRSPWSSVVSSPNTLNTANGCVTVTVDSTGMMAIGR
jgi:hypothetical protein